VLKCRAQAEDLEEEEDEEEFEDFDAEDTSGLSSEQVPARGRAASAAHPVRAAPQVDACGATAAARLTRGHTAGGRAAGPGVQQLGGCAGGAQGMHPSPAPLT